ncbi:MAG: AcrR family transcriptional regulator [Pseudohongiellaceae bacterium]|jgi:AcrR family transcriptional regulator
MSKIKRGRPVDPETQLERKNQFINAAYELLHTKSYRNITIREIAELACTKSAMISYYFGGKQELFIALLQREEGRRVQSLQAVLTAENPLKKFIMLATKRFSEDVAITRFITDDIIHHDGPLRVQFINMVPKKIAKFLHLLIDQLKLKGILRQDLDSKWAAFSLMNLIVMPFVDAFIRDNVWGISHAEVSSEEWANHIYTLFTVGCQEMNTKKGENQ